MIHDTHILTPHDLAVTGKSVANLNGMTVFLDKGLPGETVRARITAQKKRFAEGVVLESLSPSPNERPSFCPHGSGSAAECGGCAWTRFSYEAECAWKERQVMETLRRIGKLDFAGGTEYLPIQPSPRPLRYRNRTAFAFGFDAAGSPSLGLRQRFSHTVVPVDDCPLHAHPVNDILLPARHWLATRGVSVWDGNHGFCRFLVVRSPCHAPEGKRQCVIECITAPGTEREMRAVAELGRELLEKGEATGFAHSIRKHRNNIAHGETVALIQGETTVTEQLGSLILAAPIQAFTQANTAAAALLYSRIREYAGPSPGVVWDMYCGVGGIGLFLAAGNTVLRGIETVPEAVRFAKLNAKGMIGDIAFVRGDANTAFATLAPFPDLVVTDPPRAGMDKELVETLLREKPRGLIAVSCDPASLARDIAMLAPVYTVTSVQAFDLFPRTPHIEVVALLERRAPGFLPGMARYKIFPCP